MIQTSASLQTPIDPDKWQLRTLPTCLQLQNIEAVLAHDLSFPLYLSETVNE